MCNQCHTIASKRISPWKTVKEATYSDAGLEVADYLCLMCGDKKADNTEDSPQDTPQIVTVLVIVTVAVVVVVAAAVAVAAVLVVDVAVAVERQVVFKIGYSFEEVD